MLGPTLPPVVIRGTADPAAEDMLPSPAPWSLLGPLGQSQALGVSRETQLRRRLCRDIEEAPPPARAYPRGYW